MGRLVFYEYKKLFGKRLVPVLILFLFIFNILMLYREAGVKIDWRYTRKDVGRVYEDLSGLTALEAEERLAGQKELLEAVAVWREWTDNYAESTREARQDFRRRNEKILNKYPDLDPEGSYLVYMTNFYNEQKLILDVLAQVSSVAHYEDYLESIDEEAEIMTSSSLFGNPGTFSYRNIERTPPVYEHLKGTKLPAVDSEGILLATEFKLTDVLLLAVFLLLALSMMTGEREGGTLLLIKPTRKGYLETITSKLLVMLISSAATTLVFYGSSLFLSGQILGLGDLARPVQSLRGMLASPYAMTAGQYLTAFLGAKILASLTFASLLFCLCTVFRNGVSASLASAGTLFVQFVLYLTIGLHSYLSPLKILNLVCMTDASWFLGNYWNMNLFGYPVEVIPMILATAILVSGLSCSFTLVHYTKEVSALSSENCVLSWWKGLLKKRRKGKRNAKRRSIRVGLFGKEFFKVFVMERAGLLLVVFFLFQWNHYRDFQIHPNAEELFYRQYVNWAKDVPLQEVASRYQEEQKRFDEIGRLADLAAKAYAAGNGSLEEAEKAKMEMQATQNARDGFERALNQYEYVLTQVRNGTDAELFYASGWETLLNRQGQRVDVTDVGKLVFFLTVGLASVFSVEKTSQVEFLQRTCIRGGGEICRKKYLTGLLYGTLALGIAFLPRYLTVFSAYGTAGLGAPLKSLPVLSDIPFNIPLWGYLALVGLSRYLGTAVVVGLILWLSKQSGNLVHTILLGSLALLLPVFLYLMGFTGEPYLSLLPLLTGYSMYRLTAMRLIYWCLALTAGAWFYIQAYEEGSVS
ncbi:MAG: hypothetical protein HFI63_10815 [Lachnospiraceae bacterium]|nr:hypothetical protein [Lachnospiraceae bacterium]